MKKAAQVRCAVYTRKSTEEGLEQAFNSLDAQREAGEAYIASQQHEGWLCLPTRYDDGGYSGGNMDRPALRRLLADIEAGRVDCVVMYKIDRLSRSLLDFARIIEIFERHGVTFVSVTQQLSTASSMGRLMLNVLLSFAQFERELISERTRDKIAAARRKGKWSGGMPLLGYDVDPSSTRLVVNDDEALRVRAIFQMYAEEGALLPTVQKLQARGWTTKRWSTRKGRERGGKAFTKTNLHRLLTNVTYSGKVRHKRDLHDGEQAALVSMELWEKVQALLHAGRTGNAAARPRCRSGALLQGLLHCAACGCALTPSYAVRKGNRRYRYYVCSHAQASGRASCPATSVPAPAIERFVVEHLRRLASPEGAQAGNLVLAPMLTQLDATWDGMSAAGRKDALHDLLEGVSYDGVNGSVQFRMRIKEQSA